LNTSYLQKSRPVLIYVNMQLSNYQLGWLKLNSGNS
jgi:hypothetical protein